MNKSEEIISFHISLTVLNTFSPAMYVFHFYVNRIAVIAWYNPKFI